MRKEKILIVDDDPDIRDVLQITLSENYEVISAQNGKEGLVMVKTSNPDLVITDYMMPSMTGAELIGRLREQRPVLNILILTAHEAILNAEHPTWWVQEPHLGKPVKIEELRAAVTKLIGPP